MIKLVDYFVVVGYDDEPDHTSPNGTNGPEANGGDDCCLIKPKVVNSFGKAKIIQRFPQHSQLNNKTNKPAYKQKSNLHSSSFTSSSTEDSNSTTSKNNGISAFLPTELISAPLDSDHQEFDANIHCFCQPHKGWRLYKKQEPPTFFVSVLTDIKGQRRYSACLTFLEPYKAKLAHSSKENGHKTKPIEPCKLYAAKSLVLVSRLEYIDLFKSCLSLIYAVYVDKRHSADNKLLEVIVSNMLSIQVNAPGTAAITSFSLGADDRHLVQSTASLSVPSTGSSVYKLFKEIGIVNTFRLVLAILADFKVLFFSRSYTKLYDACRAVEALLFPLKYTGVYVPVLPCFGSFLEFPAAPTPYIM
jgi:hypothetical protein